MDNEAQQRDFTANIIRQIRKNGIDISLAKTGELTRIMNDSNGMGVDLLKMGDATVLGWFDEKGIHLTDSGFNPNTPLHEYTHAFMLMMQEEDPEKFNKVTRSLRFSPVWKEVYEDPSYKYIRNDKARMASEVASRIVGKEGEIRSAEGFSGKVHRAIVELYDYIAKLLGVKRNEITPRQLANMVMKDLMNPDGNKMQRIQDARVNQFNKRLEEEGKVNGLPTSVFNVLKTEYGKEAAFTISKTMDLDLKAMSMNSVFMNRKDPKDIENNEPLREKYYEDLAKSASIMSGKDYQYKVSRLIGDKEIPRDMFPYIDSMMNRHDLLSGYSELLPADIKKVYDVAEKEMEKAFDMENKGSETIKSVNEQKKVAYNAVKRYEESLCRHIGIPQGTNLTNVKILDGSHFEKAGHRLNTDKAVEELNNLIDEKLTGVIGRRQSQLGISQPELMTKSDTKPANTTINSNKTENINNTYNSNNLVNTMEPKETTENEQPKKTGAERQADIVIAALERAKQNGGILLNDKMKLAPSFYKDGVRATISPFNSVVLAMHSDEHDYKTNIVTLFSDAKKRGESVKSGQNGIPFSWYAWNEYVNKNNPEDKISRHDYKALPPEEQSNYKGIKSNEMRIVFNVEQTTLPLVKKEDFAKAVQQQGGVQDRDVTENDDVKLRMAVNDYILQTRDNLVPIQKDGSGIASYDKKKDVVSIPSVETYNSYPEYVQDITRQLVTATEHPQRLNRRSSQTYDALVTELASASKQLQLGLPAKLSTKSLQNVDAMIETLKNNPTLITSIEKDVNSSMGMIQKAAAGEKIALRPTPKEMENWRSKLPQEGTVPDKFDAVLMVKDDDGKYALYIKPEDEKAFTVHPSQNDVSMFFNLIKGEDGEKAETFRKEVAQKYYAEVAKDPTKGFDLFAGNYEQEHKDALQKVNIFRTREEEPKILISPTLVNDERLKAKELTQDQWHRMWLAPDMKDYKLNLAATMYKDEIAEALKNGLSVQAKDDGQQAKGEGLKEPVTLDIPSWSLNYIMNGESDGLSDEEKSIVDKFLEERFPDGFIPEIIEGNKKDFNVSPAFGTRNPNALPDKGESPYQAVETESVRFSPAGYFETRNENQEQKAQKPEKYDPKSEQEDKECTKLIKEIEKIDKKCRAETMPNRQRALFEEKKALEAKLQERVKMLQEQAKQKDLKSEEEKKTQKPKKSELSPLLKQFLDLKKKHPDALLLFRTGDFYETYKGDAEKASKILGITLTKSSKTKDDEGKPLAMAGFPYHALDAYLPKLIRAGQRVAICDQIEQPRQTTTRSSAGNKDNQEQEQKSAKEAPKAEKEESRTFGFHR